MRDIYLPHELREWESVNKGHQTIRCNVSGCKHLGHSNFCTLTWYEVAAFAHVMNGVPKNETLCSSYKAIS